MGFFVGQVMKRSKGKADPKAVQPVLQRRLGQAP
jgi:Asp-tRNA(Asn)/Glu-tRNA(Gln) amidotransferase B subunit